MLELAQPSCLAARHVPGIFRLARLQVLAPSFCSTDSGLRVQVTSTTPSRHCCKKVYPAARDTVGADQELLPPPAVGETRGAVLSRSSVSA